MWVLAASQLVSHLFRVNQTFSVAILGESFGLLEEPVKAHELHG